MPHGPDFPDPNRFIDYDAERNNILNHINPLNIVRTMRHAFMDHVVTPGVNLAVNIVGHVALGLDRSER